jgi:copper transporter 1
MEHSMTTMSDLGKRMSMGGPNSCLIKMTWNWNTINACFIAESWRITSNGMFAGSCIGVILLVILLEFLRRAVKEYDRYLIRNNQAKFLAALGSVPAVEGPESGSEAAAQTSPKVGSSAVAACAPGVIPQAPAFRPTILEQAIRAFLHVCQFVVAYFVMLLAMYYNGYIIICIFIGAYIGAFAFQWETLGGANTKSQTSAANEATVCCG